MAFTIIREDLARVRADAIVVPSNTRLSPDGGVALAVAKAAGYRRVKRACSRLGGCAVGQAAATPAFKLPARHIIHAVGPVWHGGGAGERELLRSAYDNALDLALRLNAQSVALPLLSAGTYGYPVREAFEVAMDAIRAFVQWADVDVMLVLFDKRAVLEGSRAVGQIAEFIDDAYAESHAEGRVPRGYSQAILDAEAGDAWDATPDDTWDAGLDAALPAGWAVAADALTSYCPHCGSSVDGGSPFCTHCGTALPVGEPQGEGLSGFTGSMRAIALADADERVAPALSAPAAKRPEPEALAAPTASAAKRPEPEAFTAPAAQAPSRPAPSSQVAGGISWNRPAAQAPAHAEAQEGAPRYGDATPAPDLGALLAQMDEPFSTMLLRLIDARGLADAQVYKRANITRQHFSKMRKPGYKPTKRTVVALAIALELSLEETRELLARAGFALSRSSKFDIIVEYFIARGQYDIFAVNEALFAYDQPLLA